MSRPDFDNPTPMQDFHSRKGLRRMKVPDSPSAVEGVVFGVLFGLCAWVLLFGTAYLLSFI